MKHNPIQRDNNIFGVLHLGPQGEMLLSSVVDLYQKSLTVNCTLIPPVTQRKLYIYP